MSNTDPAPSRTTVELSEENRRRMRDLDTAASSIIKEMGEIVAKALHMEIMDTTRFMYREITGRRIKAEKAVKWAWSAIARCAGSGILQRYHQYE
jgi:hypothetical protein